MMRMEGRTAVVIGVGSAIGAACARMLFDAGADVLVADADGATAVDIATGLGETVAWHALDSDGAAGLAAAVADRWQALDVLVDCSSAMELWPSETDTPELLVSVLATNVARPWQHTEALRAALAAAPAASVVYLGSIDGIRANPQVPGYSAGKAGVAVLTHAMAARLGADGTRVNCVAAAGIVQTPAREGPPDRFVGDRDLALRLTPLGRWPDVDEVASVVLFFASDASSYVSGAVLPVDGGRIAATPGTW